LFANIRIRLQPLHKSLQRRQIFGSGDRYIVVGLTVADKVALIITSSIADFRRAELRFPEIRIAKPTEFMAFMKGGFAQ
jgi:hypothetical protein